MATVRVTDTTGLHIDVDLAQIETIVPGAIRPKTALRSQIENTVVVMRGGRAIVLDAWHAHSVITPYIDASRLAAAGSDKLAKGEAECAK